MHGSRLITTDHDMIYTSIRLLCRTWVRMKYKRDALMNRNWKVDDVGMPEGGFCNIHQKRRIYMRSYTWLATRSTEPQLVWIKPPPVPVGKKTIVVPTTRCQNHVLKKHRLLSREMQAPTMSSLMDHWNSFTNTAEMTPNHPTRRLPELLSRMYPPLDFKLRGSQRYS